MPRVPQGGRFVSAAGEIALKSRAGAPGALLCQHRLPADHEFGQKTIAVRLADSDGQRSLASILVNRMYAWRGYGANHKLSSNRNRVTFTACADDAVIGTLSLGVDGPDGLAADETFKDELDRFRAIPGASLCELTKFACDPSTKSQPALAALFHVIFIYGTQRYDCTDLFIEVHPRHVRFYDAMLGFQKVGAPRLNPAVTWWPADVPVQLMWLKVSEIRRLIDAHAGGKSAGGRSLYPHFFSHQEEQGIWARIAALSSKRQDKGAPKRPDGGFSRTAGFRLQTAAA
jgi:hypothetical protein